MRRHVIPILILFAAVCAAVFLLFNSNWFLLRVIPSSVAVYLKPRELASLKIGRPQYRPPSTLILNDVRFSLNEDYRETNVSMNKLIIYNFMDIVRKQRKLRADVIGLNMDGQNIHIKDANFKIMLLANEYAITRGQGGIDGGSIAFDFYHAEDIGGRINIDRKKIEFLDIEAKAYGGDIKGQILLDRGVAFPSYILWMELLNWQPEQLQEINRSVFSNMRGGFNGTLRMKNVGGRIEFLTAEIAWPKGGEMSSQLIKRIFTGESLNQGALDLIINGKEKVFFDGGKFYIQNTGLSKIMVGVELTKKEGDFNIRTLRDITTPDGLEPFLFENIKTDLFTKTE